MTADRLGGSAAGALAAKAEADLAVTADRLGVSAADALAAEADADVSSDSRQ